MTVMYAARLARSDLLRPIGHLATKLHCWTPLEDKKLNRLMSYINTFSSDRSVGFIGDPLDKCELVMYADADFAGDRADSKSTGGGFLAIRGKHTFYPLNFMSSKHQILQVVQINVN